MSIYRFRLFLVLLALTICAGTMQGATALVVTSVTTGTSTPNSALSCTNGVSTSLSVTLAVASGVSVAVTSVAVTQSPASTVTITNPGSSAVPVSGNSAAWTITEPAGCKPAGSVTLTFTPTGGTSTSNTLTVTLNAPTNTYLSVSGTGSTASNPALVSCNPATGITTGLASLMASSSATGLTSSNKLTVALNSIAVTVDSTLTTYSGGTLANSPVTVAGAGSFYTGSLPLTLGLKAATPTCSALSTLSSSTPAQVTFTSAIGSGTAYPDGVILYVKVTETAPVSLSGALTLYCQGSTPVTVSTNNVTITALSSTAVSVAISGSTWIHLSASTGSATSSGLGIIAYPSACDGLTSPGQTGTGAITVGPASGAAWSTSLQVSLQDVNTSPLTAAPATLSLTYRKGGPAATGTMAISSSSAAGSYFTVIGVTGGGLGAYFTVDTSSGTAPKSPASRIITFSTTTLNDTLSPGTTSYPVILHVAGCEDLIVHVSITVNDAAPVLSVVEGTTRSISWDPSTPVPSPIVTLVSSDTPIPYTISGTSGIVIGPTSGGMAFSYGTQISVQFDQTQFQSSSPGQTLNGTLTVTGGGTTIAIVFDVLVTSASTQASLGAISPTNLPTGTAGQVFTVNLYGSGFISSTTANMTTVVGLASSAAAAGFNPHEPGISSVKVMNSSTIVMTITVPAGGKDTGSGGLLDFTQSGSVWIGVCNPNGQSCTPNSAVQLTIGSGPMITSITSSSSFTEFTPYVQGSSPAAAPYDMISIFGSNFCNSGGTGCGTSVLLGTPVNNVYTSTLSPDGSRQITVNFFTHPAATNPTPIAQAPLLFATNTQINALFPGDTSNNAALATAISAGVIDIEVGFGATGSPAFSPAVPIAVAATDPGIFTVGSDGVGDAAALVASNYAPINSTNPAIIGPTASSIAQIYMTGLGVPATDDSSCITVTAYDGYANLQSIDGAILQSSLMGGLLAPCFKTPTTSAAVTYGAVASPGTTPTYAAGWVVIPGLYYVNAQLPANASPMTDASTSVTAPFEVPMQVSVAVNGATNQPGVTMWVAPQLALGSFSSCASTAITSSYTCTFPTPSGGTGSGYAFTTSTLPGTISLGSGALSATGAPAAGSYLIAVTAADPTYDTMSVTGSFNVYASGTGQSLQLTGTTPTTSVYGIPNNAVTTVAVVGGDSTYTYSVTTGSSFAAVGFSSGIVALTGSAPVGSNLVVITATDNATNTQVGTLKFYAPVVPQIISSNGASLSASHTLTSPVALTVLSALGTTGTVTYTVETAQATAGVALASDGKTIQYTGGQSEQTAGTYSVTVKAVDGSGNIGFINLSLHLN